MYQRELLIDGERVSIYQKASGAGARVQIYCPADAPAGFSGRIFRGAEEWSNRFAAEVPHATVRALRDGRDCAIEIEILGNRDDIDQRLKGLEDELRRAVLRPASAARA